MELVKVQLAKSYGEIEMRYSFNKPAHKPSSTSTRQRPRPRLINASQLCNTNSLSLYLQLTYILLHRGI